MQPYPFDPFCPDNTLDCLKSPADAIADLNTGPNAWTKRAYGCDLFNSSTDGFAAAIEIAKEADIVVIGLGIETCGMNPAHNVNPARPGRCYQEKHTDGLVTTFYVYLFISK